MKKNNQIILKGNRGYSGAKLWDIHLPQQKHQNHIISYPAPTNHSPIIILRGDKKAHDLMTYLHTACFSPSKSTFIKAIQNNFLLSWPGLTTNLIKKHLPPSIHKELGHIKAERQGLRPTKPTKSNDSIYTIIHHNDKIFMDQTGCFSFKSSRGNEYILIV